MMAKNKFQDIIPPQKRSIRDIPLPEGRQPITIKTPPKILSRPPKREIRKAEIEPERPKQPPPGYPEFEDSGESQRRAGLWLLVLVALIIVFFGISYLFAGADVKITLKSQPVSIDQNLTATENGDNGSLPFSVITLEKEGSTEVAGNGDQKVSTKASGVIVIYNNYSSNSQSLIATTRFQTPEGLVFRINKDVVVPGQTTSGGKTIPGSVEATVFADQPGEEYNIGLKDFTIPGFQGTAKYQGFYARSKTAITGGFVGTVKKVSDQDLQSAHAKIEADLKQQFLTQANSQKPDNFILYDGSVVSNFVAEPNASGTANMVLVKEDGTAHVLVFDRDLLTQYLLNALSVSNAASSSILGLDKLTLTIQNPTALSGNATSSSLALNFKGNVNLIGYIDSVQLQTDLTGIGRSKFATILAKYPAILKAEVIFKPFWRWSFPDKANQIKIEMENPL